MCVYNYKYLLYGNSTRVETPFDFVYYASHTSVGTGGAAAAAAGLERARDGGNGVEEKITIKIYPLYIYYFFIYFFFVCLVSITVTDPHRYYILLPLID